MMKNPNFSYINEHGKKVTGSAAFIHHVFTEEGGIANYNDKVGEIYVKQFIRYSSEDTNIEIERNAKKNRFKIV